MFNKDKSTEAISPELSEAIQRVEQTSQEYENINSSYTNRVKAAERKIKDLGSEYDKLSKELDTEIRNCEDDYNGLIFSVDDVELRKAYLVANNKIFNYDDNIQIRFSARGDVYATTEIKGGGVSVGGTLVGAAVAGPVGAAIGSRKKVSSQTKVHDDRVLDVQIVSDKDGIAFTSNYGNITAYNQLQALLPSTVAKHKEIIETYLPPLEEARTRRTETLDAKKSEIDAAKQALDDIKATKVEVTRAKARRDEAVRARRVLQAAETAKAKENSPSAAKRRYILLGVSGYITYAFAGLILFIAPSMIASDIRPNYFVAPILVFGLMFLGIVLRNMSAANKHKYELLLAHTSQEATHTSENDEPSEPVEISASSEPAECSVSSVSAVSSGPSKPSEPAE